MRLRDDRHVRLASELAGTMPQTVSRKFLRSQVVIGWPEEVEGLATGPALVMTAADLILRFCPRIHIMTNSELAKRVVRRLQSVDSRAYLTTGGRLPAEISAAVWLGGGGPPTLPVLTTVSADRWVAYVSSRGDELPSLSKSANPFGPLAAAGFAAAETFKRLLPPKHGRGRLFERAVYSVFTYGAEPAQGPPLPDRIQIRDRPLLAGVGAVGQAFLHALASVPGLTGGLTVVDNELVEDETNLNRYILAIEHDLIESLPKTGLATREFRGQPVTILPEQRSLEAVLADIAADRLPRPELVICALDNDVARYELQLLWPNLVIEGATGGTLLQVFRHAYEEGLACVRCIHTAGEKGDVPFERVLSERTGLPADRISRAFRGESTTLAEEDLRTLSVEHQKLLTPHVGKDICGLLRELDGFATTGSRRIEPAVSFTSYLAGLFVASEFVRYVSGLQPGLSSRYQLDPIATLDPGLPWPESRRRDCYCVTRATVVAEYRRQAKRMG
jgi:hypothetical protein